MDKTKKSVDLPSELTVEILIRGALSLEQGESKRTLSSLKKGIENSIAQGRISNRVAMKLKRLIKELEEKMEIEEVRREVQEGDKLYGFGMNVGTVINVRVDDTRYGVVISDGYRRWDAYPVIILGEIIVTGEEKPNYFRIYYLDKKEVKTWPKEEVTLWASAVSAAERLNNLRPHKQGPLTVEQAWDNYRVLKAEFPNMSWRSEDEYNLFNADLTEHAGCSWCRGRNGVRLVSTDTLCAYCMMHTKKCDCGYQILPGSLHDCPLDAE